MLSTDKYSLIRYVLAFWAALTREEQRRVSSNASLGFITQHLDAVLQIIFSGLEMMELDASETELEDTTDDQKWTVTRASGTLLQEVALLIGDAIWNPVINPATVKLNSAQWMD